MYTAYVLSAESQRQLDAIHIEATRIISGATKLFSVSKQFADLGGETLQNRKKKKKLIILLH